MKIVRYIAVIIFFIIPALVNGQDDIQPLSPLLDLVTVDPQTGFATIRWQLSPSPDVGSYVVYTYNNGTANSIDTINSPYITEYIHTTSAAKYKSETYVVAAIDSSLNISPLSNSLSTIYLSTVNDSCESKIVISWSSYINALHPADSYKLYMEADGGPAELLEALPVSETTCTYTGYEPGNYYCFYVTACNSTSDLSSSNSTCLTSGTEVIPSWINTDAIIVNGNGLTIAGSYDHETSITGFIAQRYDEESISWITDASAQGTEGSVTLNLTEADTTVINLYKIVAVNNCGSLSAASPPVRNIVLSASLASTQINLVWNNPLPDSDCYFTVWRDSGNGWEEVATELNDTIWSEDYSVFTESVTQTTINYMITAVSQGSPASATRHRSSAIQIELPENIYVPNAFIPDSQGENALFRPEFAFIPQTYELRILSRNGVLIFRTDDYTEGWDGKHNGKLLPPGLYIWSLKLTLPSGKQEIRRGTVTILP